MPRKKYKKRKRYKKRNYSKNYSKGYKGSNYSGSRKSNEYVIYGTSSTIFYILFMIATYQLGLNNPFYDSNPGMWWIGTYFFTELVGVLAYKKAYSLVGKHGIKGAGDIRAAVRSGQHWFTRLIIYATILFITSVVLWVAYWISLLF